MVSLVASYTCFFASLCLFAFHYNTGFRCNRKGQGVSIFLSDLLRVHCLPVFCLTLWFPYSFFLMATKEKLNPAAWALHSVMALFFAAAQGARWRCMCSTDGEEDMHGVGWRAGRAMMKGIMRWEMAGESLTGFLICWRAVVATTKSSASSLIWG